MLRIVIADDHPIVRAGLARLLATDRGVEVVAEASDGDEALAAVLATRPDVVLLDLRMPGKDGIAVMRELKQAGGGAHVVVLTAENGPQAREAIRLGAGAVLLKEMAPRRLLKSIRDVAAGRREPKRRAAARVDWAASPHARIARLTARQLEIARMVVDGGSSKAIARRLQLTEGTVKLHLHNIYERLDISGRIALVRYMHERDSR